MQSRKTPGKINIAYVSTYPPQKCGIATFTYDLRRSMRQIDRIKSLPVIALVEEGGKNRYAPEVKFRIQQENLQSYLDAAEWVNNSRINVLNIQHEFGIFPYIVPFLQNLEKPVSVTLHSVLQYPSEAVKRTVMDIARFSNKLVVMTQYAADILIKKYGVDSDKIKVIPHGVPVVPRASTAQRERFKKLLNLANRQIIITFGLIRPSKGIEYAIEAISGLAKKYPRITYVVLGQSHPYFLDSNKDSYRDFLREKTRILGIPKNVLFKNQYVTLKKLLLYLLASDIFISPYLEFSQAASGPLSQALACGKAVISTPFPYALEVLSKGAGVLVPYKNASAIERAIVNILNNPDQKKTLERASWSAGSAMQWPRVAEQYDRIAQEIIP